MMSSPERAWSPPALEPGGAATAAADGPWLPPALEDATRPAAPRDASFEAGLREGRLAGGREAAEELAAALAAMRGIVRALETRERELFADRVRDVQALALAVARRLLQHEVTTDPALVSRWVAQALELLPHDLQVEIRLHPADLAAVEARDHRLAGDERGVTLRWVADESLERGGFMLESPQRLVDGRLDVALRALYERFDAA